MYVMVAFGSSIEDYQCFRGILVFVSMYAFESVLEGGGRIFFK